MLLSEKRLRSMIKNTIAEHLLPENRQRLVEGAAVKELQQVIGMSDEAADGKWGGTGGKTDIAWDTFLVKKNELMQSELEGLGVDIVKIGGDWQANAAEINFPPTLTGMIDFAKALNTGEIDKLAKQEKAEEDAALTKKLSPIKNFLKNLPDAEPSGVVTEAGAEIGFQQFRISNVQTSAAKASHTKPFKTELPLRLTCTIVQKQKYFDETKLNVLAEPDDGLKGLWLEFTVAGADIDSESKYGASIGGLRIERSKKANQAGGSSGIPKKVSGALRTYLKAGDDAVFETDTAAVNDVIFQAKGLGALGASLYKKYVPQKVWDKFAAQVKEGPAKAQS